MELALFLLGGIAAAAVIYRFNHQISRSVANLEKVLKDEGIIWQSSNDSAFKKKLFLKPSSILRDDDSRAVAAAKQDLISIRMMLPKVLAHGILCLVLGLFAAILTGLVSFSFNK